MIKIRLKRCGRKKKPTYRIVIMNTQTRRDGKPIEEVGFYNPRTKEIKVNLIKINERLKQGAKATETVKYILKYSNN
uniref:Small ribosomal subunit protein bS16c n=1 Tax=Compsopogon caeruleus TaxID=31354 RepID=A0A1Z1XAX4_9RHOD|nr:30S ribosomal protein S16 [Compsopogon caeruleus]ARX96012.1 30S ribosomal protein S16 [Compsopogon caeruleus]